MILCFCYSICTRQANDRHYFLLHLSLRPSLRPWPTRRETLEQQLVSGLRHSKFSSECIPPCAHIAIQRSPKLKLQDANSLYLAARITQFIYNCDQPHNFNDMEEISSLCKIASQWFQGMAYQIWYTPAHWHEASAFMTYARGLNALCLIFTMHQPSDYLHRVKNRFIDLSVHHRNYTWDYFNSRFIVYFKFNFLSKHSYVGMSSTTFVHRELNRRRKWLQLQKGRFTSCEQALRFWHATQTYHHYVSIVILRSHSKASTLAHEANLIATWKPSLNSPFINDTVDYNAKGKNALLPSPRSRTLLLTPGCGKRCVDGLQRHLPQY